MTLWGTKGQKNSKLCWKTDKTGQDKGLLHALWSILREKPFPAVHPHPCPPQHQ